MPVQTIGLLHSAHSTTEKIDKQLVYASSEQHILQKLGARPQAASFLAAQYSNIVDSTTSVQMVDFMFKTLLSAVACVEIRFEAKHFFNSIDSIEA